MPAKKKSALPILIKSSKNVTSTSSSWKQSQEFKPLKKKIIPPISRQISKKSVKSKNGVINFNNDSTASSSRKSTFKTKKSSQTQAGSSGLNSSDKSTSTESNDYDNDVSNKFIIASESPQASKDPGLRPRIDHLSLFEYWEATGVITENDTLQSKETSDDGSAGSGQIPPVLPTTTGDCGNITQSVEQQPEDPDDSFWIPMLIIILATIIVWCIPSLVDRITKYFQSVPHHKGFRLPWA